MGVKGLTMKYNSSILTTSYRFFFKTAGVVWDTIGRKNKVRVISWEKEIGVNAPVVAECDQNWMKSEENRRMHKKMSLDCRKFGLITLFSFFLKQNA